MHVWILADLSRSVPGGMRRHMETHAEGLRRLGHRATLLFSEDFSNDVPRWISTRLTGMRTLAAVRARLGDEKPDVVNVHTQCAPAWVVARRLGAIAARVVVMSYSADEPQVEIRQARDLLRWSRAAIPARLTFPRADGIWCVNEQDREFYASRYGTDRRKIARFPHAVVDDFYHLHADRPREATHLLFAGTWIARKGVDVVVSALDQVLSTRSDVRVTLAGTLIGEAQVRHALTPRLRERVEIVNEAGDDRLAELYRTSTLLLLPSRREGLPLVMLEAMACGCPPLAAANSGMLDVVEPGKNGWLEHSFDPRTWASRILELLERPEELARASRGASETAQNFRIETVARSVAAWYRTL